MRHSALRADCNCPQCQIARTFRKPTSIPQVMSGSRLIFGMGQDLTTDDSIDTSATDVTDTTAVDDTSQADTSTTDDTSATDTSATDTTATDDTSTTDTTTEDTTATDDSEYDPSGFSAADLAKIAASGLSLTSAGVKAAVAMGIIKKPAVSTAAKAASSQSPTAAAAAALQTGQAPKVAQSTRNKALPLLILATVAAAILLKRKK